MHQPISLRLIGATSGLHGASDQDGDGQTLEQSGGKPNYAWPRRRPEGFHLSGLTDVSLEQRALEMACWRVTRPLRSSSMV